MRSALRCRSGLWPRATRTRHPHRYDFALPSCPACRRRTGRWDVQVARAWRPARRAGRGARRGFPCAVPAATRGRRGEAVMVEGESSCFYHPQKKAVVPCQGCGRFLCALCDCGLHGEHFCPACLEVGRQKGRITRLESQRTLYDAIALAVAVLRCWSSISPSLPRPSLSTLPFATGMRPEHCPPHEDKVCPGDSPGRTPDPRLGRGHLFPRRCAQVQWLKRNTSV